MSSYVLLADVPTHYTLLQAALTFFSSPVSESKKKKKKGGSLTLTFMSVAQTSVSIGHHTDENRSLESVRLDLHNSAILHPCSLHISVTTTGITIDV